MSLPNSPANVALPASPAGTVGYASPGAASDKNDTESDDAGFPEAEAQQWDDGSQRSSATDNDIRDAQQLEQDGKLLDAYLTVLGEFREQQATIYQLKKLVNNWKQNTKNFLENAELSIKSVGGRGDRTLVGNRRVAGGFVCE